MHAYDHGVAMHIIKAIVKTVKKLEIDLGLPNNTLMHKLTARLHNLSSSLDSKHTTLMGFTNQSIVSVFETLTTPDKKGKKQSPIVDAGDVQKLMLVLPYVLDGLADEFIVQHKARLGPANHVVDPFPDTIMAINEWLHWCNTNIYVYLHTYTCRYMYIRTDTCIYIFQVRICTYMYIYCTYMFVYVCISMYFVFTRHSRPHFTTIERT